jgi:hypothetical protein
VRAIGGFDTAFSPVYYEDADLCLRLAQAGWRVQLIPTMQAVHHEGVTLQYSATYYRHIHRNRIRFALKHLSAEEWKYGFVPAELHRLRHELHTATGDDALTISGVDAIEAVLRGIDEDAGWDGQPIVPVWPARVGHIDLASELVEVAGTRWYVDPALEQQRQFNAEVVRALDAHDHMHREQTAALLLVALDALGRLKTLTKTSSAPTE